MKTSCCNKLLDDGNECHPVQFKNNKHDIIIRPYNLIKRQTRHDRASTLCLVFASVLILLFVVSSFCLQISSLADVSVDPLKNDETQNHQKQEFKLSCKVGEQRHFNYESATKVWGSTSQQVFLRATMRLSCMEPAGNGTLKYLAEILGVSGDFGDVVTYNSKRSQRDGASRRRPGSNDQLRAEPVFEEVGEAIGEAADRFKRSVSGWFTKTWGSVKDFFVNIFASSEKSTVSREDVFRESGIDISSQCRAGADRKPSNGLPIDDSVFDDLEPKYYIGASSVSASVGGIGDAFRHSTTYEFDPLEGDEDDDASVSFFDDPKPLKRPKRAAANDPTGGSGNRALGSQNELDHERLLRLPFVFVQSRTGRVIEVRFSGEESDLSVKNFKRHLCDLFATNLDSNRSQTNELSPIGQHTTKYIIDPTLNSSFIKQSLLKSAAASSLSSADQTKFLVKALGVTQQRHQQHVVGMAPSQPPAEANFNSGGGAESRNPASSGSQGDGGQSLSVLRSINSTSSLQLNSRTIAPDIDQIQVRVKQVQQINEGRMVGSAGLLAMSLVQSNAAVDNGNSQKLELLRMGRSTETGKLSSPGQLEDIADLLKVSTSFTVQLVPLSQLGKFNSEDVAPGGVGVNGAGGGESGGGEANGRTAGDGTPKSARGKRAFTPSSAVPTLSSLSSRAQYDDSSLPTDRWRLSGNSQASKLSEAVSGSKKVASENNNDADSDSNNDNNRSNLPLIQATRANQPIDLLLLPPPNGSSSSSSRLSHQTDNYNANSDNNTTTMAPAQSSRTKPILQVKRSPIIPSSSPSREPLVIQPSDELQLQRILMEWRQLELQLKLVPSNLLPESSGQDGQLQRLEILRDQIRMRLNEEYMRNRLRHTGSSSSSSDELGKQVAATTLSKAEARQPAEGTAKLHQTTTPTNRNDLGLGLTQLILDSGVTAKRKGSVYGTIEEVLELEMALGEEAREGSVSRLMRDTIRIDALRLHCKSAIASLEEIRAQPAQRRAAGSSKVEIRSPFGMLEHGDRDGESDEGTRVPSSERLARIIGAFQTRNRRKLDQCKQVVQLLLRVGDKQAANLVLELMDECNNRMLSGAKFEELGHGPTSRYYRNLRQQFTELMANINRPSEQLLDKLVARLHYSKLNHMDGGQEGGKPRIKAPIAPIDPQQEFTYVSPKQTLSSSSSSGNPMTTTAYNRSLLREEDNYNNDEGAGSLVMTITSLASKPSIGRPKKLEVVDKLLQTLKGSSCSLFHGPDLDILESMGNFQEPLDEMVGKILHLARRCGRQHDQYLVACVHGLQGQLCHPATVRFLADQLKSKNGSCTVKSEIVLTLIGSILVDELGRQQQQVKTHQIPARESAAPAPGSQWPAAGLNQVDEVLLELVGDDPLPAAPSAANMKAKRVNMNNAQDRRCLKQLVNYYMGKKRHHHQNLLSKDNQKPPLPQASGDLKPPSSIGSRSVSSSRPKRAVVNDDSFWDEAQCKRWALPDVNALASDNNNSLSTTPNDLVDEIDDNSILLALSQHHQNKLPPSGGRSARRQSQKLIEREADLPGGITLANGSPSTSSNSINSSSPIHGPILNGSIPIIRRRHKCTASKSFGPKNAQAILKAEIVNDLVGARDENKFLARFRLATNFLGNRIDVGRMYLWHQKHTTRAHVNILGKSLWDTSHGCEDKAPRHLLYMPLFDFNLWLVKISVGLRLHSEMGFFSNCDPKSNKMMMMDGEKRSGSDEEAGGSHSSGGHHHGNNKQLELFPTMSVRASGEASAKFVVARAGMSLASQYGYQGNIKVSQQPESCMSISSAHQPMNITFASWFQLWDSDCHYWGSRNKAEPQATKWKLSAHKPSIWLDDECLIEPKSSSNGSNSSGATDGLLPASSITRSLQTISP